MPEAARFLDAVKTRLGIAPAGFQKFATDSVTGVSAFIAALPGLGGPASSPAKWIPSEVHSYGKSEGIPCPDKEWPRRRSGQ